MSNFTWFKYLKHGLWYGNRHKFELRGLIDSEYDFSDELTVLDKLV